MSIEIKGISREGNSQYHEMGACNEIIGLEFDGNQWTPLDFLPSDFKFDDKDVIDMWVHKTTYQNNVIVKKKDNSFHYVNKGKLELLGEYGVHDTVNAMNNVICIANDYHYFVNGKYTAITNKDISFDMQLDMRSNGVGLLYGTCDEDTQKDIADKGETWQGTYARNMLMQLASEVSDANYLVGTAFMRYAVKLYNGTYINVSAPVLVSDCDMADVKFRNEYVALNSFGWFDAYSGNKALPNYDSIVRKIGYLVNWGWKYNSNEFTDKQKDAINNDKITGPVNLDNNYMRSNETFFMEETPFVRTEYVTKVTFEKDKINDGDFVPQYTYEQTDVDVSKYDDNKLGEIVSRNNGERANVINDGIILPNDIDTVSAAKKGAFWAWITDLSIGGLFGPGTSALIGAIVSEVATNTTKVNTGDVWANGEKSTYKAQTENWFNGTKTKDTHTAGKPMMDKTFVTPIIPSEYCGKVHRKKGSNEEFGFAEFNGELKAATPKRPQFFASRNLPTPVFSVINAMPKELEDIVVSVDIFMTKPVSIFEDKMHYFGQEESAQRKFKTQSKIEEELAESLGNFYMIHSIPFDDIVKAEVNKVYAPYIERGRISQIEQQPTLQSYSQHIDRYKVSYMYNNSLHVAGLTTEFFKGYDRSIVPICSPSRDEGTSAEAKIRSLVGVKDLIDDVRLNASVTINDNGNKYTVSTPIHIPDLANEYAFRWFVYPDEKAEFMEVNGLTIVSHSLTKRNVMTIPIKKEIIYKLSAKNGFAYKESMKDVKMLDSELSLFDVAGATKTEESLKFRANKSDDKFSAQLSDNETNLYERTKNLMKVSAVGDIEEFPYAKTYLVGSGEIIGLSTATTALSQGQFGQFPLYVFCTDGIYVMEQGSGGAYVNTKPLSREVCNNANSITQIDGAVVFSTAKGLMVISGGKVEPFAHHLIGRIYYRPTDEFAQGWYKRAISHEQLVELYDAVSSVDFLKYLSDKATRISYIYDKGKLMVYNPTFVYCYFIDIQSGRASKLNRQVLFTNNDYPSEQYALLTEEAGIVYTVMPYRYEGEHVETMLQTQPIRIDPNNFTRNTRVVLRGYFNSPEHVGIYVYGSNDSHAWAYIGGTEKKGEVYDLGTTIERMTVKYLMVVFVGRLHDDSYINELEIMGDTKYNYKLR